MKTKKAYNPSNIIFKEFKEEDGKYGGKKIKKVDSDIREKRPVRNLKKAWEQHSESDWDETDDFYGN